MPPGPSALCEVWDTPDLLLKHDSGLALPRAI
jgi:hypothetical protein